MEILLRLIHQGAVLRRMSEGWFRISIGNEHFAIGTDGLSIPDHVRPLLQARLA